MKSTRQNIFEYDNYRTYLKDQFKWMKEDDPKFSHRGFGKRTGIKGPSFFLDVMKGHTNLTQQTIEKISKALTLSKEEKYYFKFLVLLNQATTIDERMLYAKQLLKSKAYRKVNPLAEATYRYFVHWYFVAIKELVGFSDFDENPQWIVSRLADQVSVQEVKTALAELQKLGLIARDTNGKLSQVENMIVTPDEVTSSFGISFHEQILKLCAQILRKYPREQRELSATTFRISQKNFNKVKEYLQRFRKELVELLSDETDPDGLYQLNLQLFPLAPFQKIKDEDDP